LLLASAVLALALPANAQDRGTLSAGWRLLHAASAGVDGDGETMPAGWYGDVAYDVDEMISLVGDVSGAYKSSSFEETVLNTTVSRDASFKTHTFMGGLRFSARQNPSMIPFVQVLFGAAHQSTNVDEVVTRPGLPPVTRVIDASSGELAFDIGGGLTFNATENLDMRVGASYLRIGGDGGGNGFRLSLGAIFPF
jgi:hypothetical protein